MFGFGHTDTVNPYEVNANAFDDQHAAANKKTLTDALAARQGIATPQGQTFTAGQSDLDTTQQAQFRGAQSGLVSALQDQAAGKGPSMSGMQLQQGLDQAIASQHSQAASARGVSPALAARLAAQGIAGLQHQASVDSAMTRMQEQQNAQQQLGGVLAGARGQDIGLAGQSQNAQQQLAMFNANQQQQGSFQNAANSQQSQAQLDAMTQYYISQGLSIDQASFQANQAWQQLQSQNYNATQATNAGIAQGNTAAQTHLAGAVLGAGAAGAAAAAGK